MLDIPGESTSSIKASARNGRERDFVPCPKALKGRPAMQSSSQSAYPSLPARSEGSGQSRTAEDLTYQAVTVAAALLLLVSLWVF